MAYFGSEVLVAVLVIAGIGITAVLHILGRFMAREVAVHDLRVRATALRNAYVSRLQALDNEPTETDDVYVLPSNGEPLATPVHSKAA